MNTPLSADQLAQGQMKIDLTIISGMILQAPYRIALPAWLAKLQSSRFGAGMRFSTIPRSVAWLIIMALLVQPWLGQRAVAKASEPPGVLVICAGTGFKVISAPADLLLPDDPVEAPNHHDSATANCLACLVQALCCLNATGRIDQLGLYRYWTRERNIVDLWAAEPLCHRPLGSRGPPSV